MRDSEETSSLLQSEKLGEEFDSIENYVKSNMDYQMGIGRWRPQWLHHFNSLKLFTVIIVLYALVEGVAQKQLWLHSKKSIRREFRFSHGVMVGLDWSNSLALLASIFTVGLFSYRQMPKWLATSGFLSGIGALLFALPKLIKGVYVPETFTAMSSPEMCEGNRTLHKVMDPYCANRHDAATVVYAIIMILGQCVMGVGRSQLYVIGSVYIEENAPPRSSPIYFGVFLVSLALGPLLGSIFGVYNEEIYTNIIPTKGIDASQRNTTWVDAWWLGYIVVAVLFLLLGCILTLFPKKIKDGVMQRTKAVQRGELPPPNEDEVNMGFGFKDLLKLEMKVAFNLPFMLACTGLGIKLAFREAIGESMVMLLHPKFGVSAKLVLMSLGSVMLISMTVGIMGGAFVVYLYSVKKAAKASAKICAVISLLTIIQPLAFFIPGCLVDVDGVKVPTGDRATMHAIKSGCNSNCSCSNSVYHPVCGANGVTFPSPCDAGCRTALKYEKNKMAFTNCTCIPNPALDELFDLATPGKCDHKCKNYFVFVAIFGAAMLIWSFSATPHMIMIMRCVPDRQRLFMACLMYMDVVVWPEIAEVIFELTLPKFCRKWSYNRCGVKEKCIDSNVEHLSLFLILLGICLSVLAALCYFIAWRKYPDNYEVEKKEEDE